VHNLAIQPVHTIKPCGPTNLAASGETTETLQGRRMSMASSPRWTASLGQHGVLLLVLPIRENNLPRQCVQRFSDANGFLDVLPEASAGSVRG